MDCSCTCEPSLTHLGKKMNFSFSRGLIKVAYHYFFILQSYRPTSPWIFTKRVQYKF